MARQEMFVDLAKLKQVIDQLEDEQIAKGAPLHRPFRSRNELHKAVASTDWGQSIGLTPVVVALRIDRYAIDCKTGVRARVMTVAPVAPPIALVASTSPVEAPGVDSGADPDFVPVPPAPPPPVASAPLQRKSMFRGIDLDAFIAPFLERGIDIRSLDCIMTSALHSKNMNLKIQAAWHDLRERFNIPRVGDKQKEIQSILPLDQIRLPGSEVGESISDLEAVPASTEFNSEVIDMSEDLVTDDELIADEFPEFYKPVPTEVYDEVQPVDDPFYDPATDEATLDQVEHSLDVIEQEGGVYTQAADSEPFTREDLAQVRDDLDAIWQDGQVVSDAGLQNEYDQESGVTLDQEPYLGELSPEDELAAPAGEFYGEFEGTAETPSGEFHGEFTPTGTTPQGETVGEFHGEFQTTGEVPQVEDQDSYLESVFSEPEPVQDHQDYVQSETDEYLEEGEYSEIPLDQEEPQDHDAAQEFDEWLAAGEIPPADRQSERVEVAAAPQDEYLPLDFDNDSAPVQSDADDYDSSVFEVEETDPNETR